MKILILENDSQLPEGWKITEFAHQAEKKGHEVRYVFNVYHNAKEVIENINWCNVLAFGTTWVYASSILNLTNAIAQYRKEELQIIIDYDNVEARIRDMVETSSMKFHPDDSKEGGYFDKDEALADAFAYSLRKLKIFQMARTGSKHIPITVLDERIERETGRIATIKAYMESRHEKEAQTGRMIRIKTVIAVGPEFSVLKKGTVVPEINMELLDQNPNRGVWVMGKTEPVKLLNEDNYDEFEIVARSLHDLAEEFVRKCSAPMSKKNFFIVMAILKEDEFDIHDKAKLICDSLGVERRFNKSYMMQRMQATNEQFKFEAVKA